MRACNGCRVCNHGFIGFLASCGACARQGAKLAVGHVPLYARGDDANARQFGSLHAVQRHMADTGRFKMAWEDNEDEYDDFYRWPEDEEAPDAPEGNTRVDDGIDVACNDDILIHCDNNMMALCTCIICAVKGGAFVWSIKSVLC